MATHQCWDLKEQYGSPDGLGISIDGVDIPLFFLKLLSKAFSFVELVTIHYSRKYHNKPNAFCLSPQNFA